MIGVFINPGRTPEQPEPSPKEWGDRTTNRPTEYDINYAWGIGLPGTKQGGAMLPEMMRWLWRDHGVSTDPKDTVERSFNVPAK